MAKDITVVLTLNNSQFEAALKTSTKNVKQFEKTSVNASNGIGNAFKALAGVLASVGVVRLADEFTTLNNRLIAVTKSEKEAADALNLVKQVASETRSDLSAVAGLFADITIASEELGLSQERVAGIAKVFSQTLKISGADAGTAAGAIRQFGQALASGTLRGDEFNSINEANSRFMGELAESLGVTRGELRKLAEQGKITASAMITATERMARSVEEDFAKTTLTIGDAFTKLRNSTILLFGTIEQETGVFESIANGLDRIATSLEGLGPSIVILAQIASSLALVYGSVKLLRGGTAVLKQVGDELFKIGTKGSIAAKGGSLLNKAFRNIYGIGVQLKKALKALFSADLVKSIRAIGFAVLYVGRAFLIFTGLAGVIIGIATAINLLVKAFTGFSIVDWVVDKFKNLWSWITKTAVELGLMDEAVTVAGGSLNDGADAANALAAAEAAAAAQARALAEAASALDDLFAGLLTDLDAGKFNTTLENAQNRLNKATEASVALAIRIAELDKGSKDYDKTLAHLLRVQEAVNAEIGQSTDVISDLHNQYKQLVDDAREGISLDFGLKELETQLAEFDLSDVDKDVNQFFRDIQTSFEKNQKSIKELLADRDLPEEYKKQLQELLDTLPGFTEEAKKRGEELIRAIADKEKLKEQTKAFNDALEDLGTIDSFDGLEAFRLRIEELARTAGITAEQFEKLKQEALDVEASLGAGAGIGKALEDIGKQFTPFQMAVDATTMAWGHMSNAIDEFVETGKASFSDLAKSILKDLAKMILKQMLYNALVGAIKGGAAAFGFTIPGLADGGTAQKNKPYIVGEEGPELFVPGATGTVVPNDKLGGMGGQVSAPVTNNYITNNINALDSRSVAQVFAENRQTLLGTVEYARKETAYGV